MVKEYGSIILLCISLVNLKSLCASRYQGEPPNTFKDSPSNSHELKKDILRVLRMLKDIGKPTQSPNVISKHETVTESEIANKLEESLATLKSELEGEASNKNLEEHLPTLKSDLESPDEKLEESLATLKSQLELESDEKFEENLATLRSELAMESSDKKIEAGLATLKSQLELEPSKSNEGISSSDQRNISPTKGDENKGIVLQDNSNIVLNPTTISSEMDFLSNLLESNVNLTDKGKNETVSDTKSDQKVVEKKITVQFKETEKVLHKEKIENETSQIDPDEIASLKYELEIKTQFIYLILGISAFLLLIVVVLLFCCVHIRYKNKLLKERQNRFDEVQVLRSFASSPESEREIEIELTKIASESPMLGNMVDTYSSDDSLEVEKAVTKDLKDKLVVEPNTGLIKTMLEGKEWNESWYKANGFIKANDSVEIKAFELEKGQEDEFLSLIMAKKPEDVSATSSRVSLGRVLSDVSYNIKTNGKPVPDDQILKSAARVQLFRPSTEDSKNELYKPDR